MNKKITFHYNYIDGDYKRTLETKYQRLKWTQNLFGRPGVARSWFVRTYSTPNKYGFNDQKEVFYFKDEKYATMFMLRWS